MMATLTGPSTVGPGLLAFLDAYQKAQQAARQDEALGRQNALAALQMNEILRKRQEGELDREALAALPAVVPPPVVTPPMAPTPEQTARMESAFTEPIPATPPPAPGGLTPQVLAQQIGPAKTARILGTEQGRAAFGAMGGMTPEAWEAKKRVQDFRAKAEGLYRTGVAAQHGGDPRGDVDAQLAITAALMDIADPKDYPNLLASRQNLVALRKSIDDEERYAKEDAPKLARARQLFIKGHMEGDSDAVAEGYRLASEVKTKYGRDGATHLYDHLEKTLIEKGQLYQGPLGQIEQRANAALKQKAMLGPITNADRVAALRADYAANPRQWGAVLAAFAQSGKEVPRDYQVAATGAYFTKDETLAASHIAEQNPQDPNAFITALKAIHAAKQRPYGDTQGHLDRRAIYRELNADIRQINRDIAALGKGVFKTPQITAQITALETNRAAKVRRRDDVAKLMGAAGETLPEPEERAGGTGRAATRGEIQEAKRHAGITDVLTATEEQKAKAKAYLIQRGIDPALEVTR